MPLDLDLQVRGCRSGALAGSSKTVCPATRIAALRSKMTGRSPRNVIVVSNERVPFAAHYDGSAIVRGC
jgi:hypothetical protein